MQRILAALAVSAVVLLPAAGHAQQPPEMPKPGPEHDLLKQDVGVWDASVEMAGPTGQMTTSAGTETVSMIGFWQVSQFKGQMMGEPFQGLGTSTWDPTKKKYVGTWIDSMTPGYSSVESEYDASTKSMSGTMEGPDMSGKTVKMREVTEWKDPANRVFTMYGPKGADGKEPVILRITYKRRK